MTNANNAQEFHSGKRLQKLRELQGLSLVELAQVLSVPSSALMQWEAQGVPDHNVKACCDYFEVAESFFSQSITSQKTLNQAIETHLFAQTNDSLQQRLQANRISQSAQLNLSGFGLNQLPPEILSFKWLKELDLSNNKLKRLIPSEMMQLLQIEVLNVSNNSLTYMPGIMHRLSLKQLDFTNNPLTFQTALLQSAMNLGAYLEYVNGRRVSIAIVEPSVGIGHQRYDALSNEIEKTQPLLITTITDADEILLPYKEQINSIIYLAPSRHPENMAGQLEQLQQTIECPLIIYTGNQQQSSQHDVIKQQLMTSCPTRAGLIFEANNQAEFATLFGDIQYRIDGRKLRPSIKFERLTLENIGVYEHLEISFNPELTVLIGLNGAGKTTILKALALATLGAKHAGFDDTSAADLLRIIGNDGDKAQWQPQGSIVLQVNIDGEAYENTVYLSYNTDTEKVEVKGNRFAQLFENQNEDNLINLMLGIGEQRITSQKAVYRSRHEKLKPKVKDLLPLISGEEQACIAQFSIWLGNLAFNVSQGDKAKQALIDISFAIFSALMQEPIQFAGLTSVEPMELWIEHQDPKQRVPLRLASQGYQAVMGWVGFIIQRMFEAYPSALQPLQQPAIILIDEIDQLLHVKWQQKILNVLAKQFFPNIQWIITTHSPMVLNGLDQEQVLQIQEENGTLTAQPSPTDLWLWQYGDVVNYLFKVPQEKPQEQETLLQKEIAAIKAIAPAERTEKQLKNLVKLELRLEKTQKSLAYVDELYAEQNRLREREQQLAALIEQLNQQSKV
jgi:predicted ATP-binding protein involved in virulence/transcriptional regulator with XRE-family HTH domain